MVDFQDPYLISIHLITDPGQGHFLQRAADEVLSWVHPELQLFRVSERAACLPTSKHHWNFSLTTSHQLALAVMLFLPEADDREEDICKLQRILHNPPWCYHHTEKVCIRQRTLALTSCSQDFFTLCQGTPLWAVRQVHYGKEMVRFTMYCRYENYSDMVQLYTFLLQRRVAQKKEDICFFIIYSNPDVEIQLSFKRLPRGENLIRLESTVMEVKVKDVGVLVPLLPHPCSPISDIRWQTEDYDGNKILLQVQGCICKQRSVPCHLSPLVLDSTSAQSTSFCHSYNHMHHHQQLPRHPKAHLTSHWSLPVTYQGTQQLHTDNWKSQWTSQQSQFSHRYPSTCSTPYPTPTTPHKSSLIPPFRINVDSLIGAEETDVDTGKKVNPVVQSVVSAYIKSSLAQTFRPLSASFDDIGQSLSPPSPDNSHKPSSLIQTPHSFSDRHTSSPLVEACQQSVGENTSSALSLSDVSISPSDICGVTSGPMNEETEEDDDQEFYI